LVPPYPFAIRVLHPELENPELEKKMAEKHNCEMFLVRYVPDVERGEFVNIGVVLIESDEQGAVRFADVRFTRDWKKLNCFAPELERADMELLEEAIRGNLQAPAATAWVHENQVSERDLLLRGFRESWSGTLDVAQVKGVVTGLAPQAELELLEQRYLVPLGRVRKEAGGRQAILREMQEAFKKQGIWDLLLKNIPAKDYGLRGDSFKIDLGYRPNGVVKTFHAVSMIRGERDQGRLLVHRWPKLRAGIMEKEKAQVELTAVVETELPEGDDELEDVMTQMLSNEIQVRRIIEMPSLAEQARRELIGA